MKTRISPLGALFLLLLTFLASVNGSIRHLDRDDVTGHVGSTREEVLATRERRKKQFNKKLDGLKQQWEDHVSGNNPLQEGFETQRLQKKIKALENKLEYLNREVDDRHIERLIDREEMLNEVHRERILNSRDEL